MTTDYDDLIARASTATASSVIDDLHSHYRLIGDLAGGLERLLEEVQREREARRDARADGNVSLGDAGEQGEREALVRVIDSQEGPYFDPSGGVAGDIADAILAAGFRREPVESEALFLVTDEAVEAGARALDSAAWKARDSIVWSSLRTSRTVLEAVAVSAEGFSSATRLEVIDDMGRALIWRGESGAAQMRHAFLAHRPSEVFSAPTSPYGAPLLASAKADAEPPALSLRGTPIEDEMRAELAACDPGCRHECPECRMGLGSHLTCDPRCAHHGKDAQ